MAAHRIYEKYRKSINRYTFGEEMIGMTERTEGYISNLKEAGVILVMNMDELADILEQEGQLKEAYNFDVLSNSVERIFHVKTAMPLSAYSTHLMRSMKNLLQKAKEALKLLKSDQDTNVLRQHLKEMAQSIAFAEGTLDSIEKPQTMPARPVKPEVAQKAEQWIEASEKYMDKEASIAQLIRNIKGSAGKVIKTLKDAWDFAMRALQRSGMQPDNQFITLFKKEVVPLFPADPTVRTYAPALV